MRFRCSACKGSQICSHGREKCKCKVCCFSILFFFLCLVLFLPISLFEIYRSVEAPSSACTTGFGVNAGIARGAKSVSTIGGGATASSAVAPKSASTIGGGTIASSARPSKAPNSARRTELRPTPQGHRRLRCWCRRRRWSESPRGQQLSADPCSAQGSQQTPPPRRPGRPRTTAHPMVQPQSPRA